jgi:hypothetical protein
VLVNSIMPSYWGKLVDFFCRKSIINNMKKIIALFPLFLFSIAQAEGGVKVGFPNPLKWETLGELIAVIINFLRNISFALVPMMVIISAFYFLTSGGDPNKVKTGKNILVYTVIGLAIILLSHAIIDIVETTLWAKESTSTEKNIDHNTPPPLNPGPRLDDPSDHPIAE